MKNIKRKLDRYIYAFAEIYKVLHYKDAYKIINKFYPELTMEEFVEALKQNIQEFFSWIRLEQDGEYWIYDRPYGHDWRNNNSILLEYVEMNYKYGTQPIKVLDAIDYEKNYSDYPKNYLNPLGEKIKQYLINLNPGVTKQRFAMWVSIFRQDVTDELANENEIVDTLIEKKCNIGDKQIFLKMIREYLNSCPLQDYKGRTIVEYQNDDMTNCFNPSLTLKQRNMIGYSTIYQFFKAAVRLYPCIDAYTLSKIIKHYYPFANVEKEVYGAIKAYFNDDKFINFFDAHEIKICAISKTKSYFSKSNWDKNYIIINSNDRMNTSLLNIAFKINNSNALYITPTASEFIQYSTFSSSLEYGGNFYEQLYEFVNKKLRYELNAEYLSSLRELIIRHDFDLDEYICYLSENINAWCSRKKWQQLVDLVCEWYWNERLPWLYGFTRKEFSKLNMVPLNYDRKFRHNKYLPKPIDLFKVWQKKQKQKNKDKNYC